MYINDKINGFGRICFANGSYYIGMQKDGKKHGYGKHVFANGKIKEGIWENGVKKA